MRGEDKVKVLIVKTGELTFSPVNGFSLDLTRKNALDKERFDQVGANKAGLGILEVGLFSGPPEKITAKLGKKGYTSITQNSYMWFSNFIQTEKKLAAFLEALNQRDQQQSKPNQGADAAVRQLFSLLSNGHVPRK